LRGEDIENFPEALIGWWNAFASDWLAEFIGPKR